MPANPNDQPTDDMNPAAGGSGGTTERFVRALGGKTAEFAAERIKRGDKISVSGQLVQRMYNEKLFLDIKNASVTFLEDRAKTEEQELPF